jgi:hypothetical protein
MCVHKVVASRHVSHSRHLASAPAAPWSTGNHSAGIAAGLGLHFGFGLRRSGLLLRPPRFFFLGRHSLLPRLLSLLPPLLPFLLLSSLSLKDAGIIPAQNTIYIKG